MKHALTLALVALSVLSASCNHQAPPRSQATVLAGKTTVVWISIDGLRHDYIDRIKPSTLTRLQKEGAYSNELWPIFPSLTFPNHAAQVTGLRVDGHGIPANAFYDPETQKGYNLPDEATLFRAEPIWVTAKRQGVRSAIIAWPMSHSQPGPLSADYFDQHYNKKETDAQRLDRIVDLLKADHGQEPIRLVMTYMFKLDSIGHQFGPDSPEVSRALLDVDATVGRFVVNLTAWFDATHSPQDELFLFISTDHGMENIRTSVNLDHLIGGDLLQGVKIAPSGPIATLHLLDLPADEKSERMRLIIEKLRKVDYLTVWPAKEVPAKYHFADRSRLGDLVVMLKPGYAFTPLRLSATQPAVILKGNHGYDPAETSNMLGSAVIWRYRHPYGGVNIGHFDNTQWYPTATRLLGITPASGSDSRPIPLPR